MKKPKESAKIVIVYGAELDEVLHRHVMTKVNKQLPIARYTVDKLRREEARAMLYDTIYEDVTGKIKELGANVLLILEVDVKENKVLVCQGERNDK